MEHLRISECIVASRPLLISTVLGSCVSVTFFHERTRLAGVFHAMLPDSATSRNGDGPCKFVDSAIRHILAQFDARCVPRREITAKLFGGAYSMGRGHERADKPDAAREVRSIVDVGRKNVDMARQVMREENIPIVTENTLGERGRKLFFATSTGEVWMKYLNRVFCSDGRGIAEP